MGFLSSKNSKDEKLWNQQGLFENKFLKTCMHMGFENEHRSIAMQIGIMHVGPGCNWDHTMRLVIAAAILSEFPLLPT